MLALVRGATTVHGIVVRMMVRVTTLVIVGSTVMMAVVMRGRPLVGMELSAVASSASGGSIVARSGQCLVQMRRAFASSSTENSSAKLVKLHDD